MTNLAALLPTFDALKPGLEADFIANVTKRCDTLIANYPEGFRQLSGQWGRDANEYRQLRSFINDTTYSARVKGEAPTRTTNHVYIAKQAKTYADDQIAAFTHKLLAKLGDLNDVVIHNLSPNAFTFRISGTKLGHKISIEQNRIINVSPKGTMFHQWPSRIYVDGKFTPEKAYKALEAAPATLETADLPVFPEAAPAPKSAPAATASSPSTPQNGAPTVYSIGTVRTWKTMDGGGTAGTLLLNGKKVADFENGGYGGPTMVQYLTTAFRDAHIAYCAAIPDRAVDMGPGRAPVMLKVDNEFHVDDLVTLELRTRDYTKLLRNKIAVVRPDGAIAHLVGVKPTPDAIARFKANPKHAHYKVLNDLPFAEGFALYTAKAA